jgi:deoxyribose-phosphate aldolase
MIDLTQLDARTLARTLDYSILPKQTTEMEVREGCAVMRRYGFAAFYASSAYWAPVVREELAGMNDIEIGAGIAFPFGAFDNLNLPADKQGGSFAWTIQARLYVTF